MKQSSQKAKLPSQEFLVERIYGAFYEIYNPTQGKALAVLRGKLRLGDKEERNPIAVGDRIIAFLPNDSDKWIIESRENRKNKLIRKSGESDTHVLCTNVDYVVVLASLKDPETKNGFLDRSIAAAYQAEIPIIIAFTKKDLVSKEDLEYRISLYAQFGYDCIGISIFEKESLDLLRQKIKGCTSYFVGNSGTGKSSLVNALLGEQILTVNDISYSTNKGKHTTTNSRAVHLDEDTIIIDSPGVKEWGILHLTKSEILESFPELRNLKEKCQNPYCCDLQNNCEMILGLQTDQVSAERRDSMENMITSLDIPYRLRTGNFKSGKIKGQKKSHFNFD